MTTFFDAFISYGRADSKAFAQKVQARLDEQGFNIWFDFNDIPLAVDFQNQIDDGIEKATHFLFIIAPHSVNSPYCLKEIELAIKLNKRIIPLLHVMQISQETWQQRNPNGTPEEWEAYKAKGLHESYQNMHPTIQKLNWVYFQEGVDDFEKSFADLVKLLRSHPDYLEKHTRFLVKALEWERNKKQTNCLLTGEEKKQAKAWLNIRFKDEQSPCVPTDLHCEYITESVKNANNLMTQVIISYADEDRATMEKIRRSLRRESITVWTNTTDIKTGEAFETAIHRGIEQADNLVFLLSPESVNSTYCQQELELALSLHKRIIPVLVRETEPNQVPTVLRELQYIDLTDNVKDYDYLLDESQLLKTLNQNAAYYNEHKILLTKALKWQRQQNNPSILLRGYNLHSAEAWLKVAQKRTQHPPTTLQEEFIAESLRQPPLESLDVFISYSRADSDFARTLNDALQMQGKTTWFDQESIASGSDFQQEIYRGIRVCDNILFVLSPRSVNSPYCADEVEYAAKLNKRFVTVLHQQVNTADLHPELAKVQWIDFNQNQRDFNANFNQLVRTFDTDREHVHSHSKWLQRALEWQQKGKSADLLLRGKEVATARKWLIEAEQHQKKPTLTALQKEYIAKSRQVKYRSLTFKALFGLTAAFSILGISIYLLIGSMFTSLVFGWFNSVVFSPDGKTIASASDDGTIKLWNIEGQQQQTIEGYSVVFSPDGKTIASANDDNTIRLWNLQGQQLQTLKGHTDAINRVVFSPDGKTIASASDDETIKLWNLQGQQLQTLKGHTDLVVSVAFSPDGKTIASASDDETIKLWNLQGQQLRTLKRD